MAHPAIEEITPWTPLTEDDKQMVREQMRRLLETSHFKNSRRYPALLQFIVEETLEGRGELLKERLLGIHVFDRPPDYDTASDPIVRVTIAEIRKRIAQYYHEEAHESEMRIELLPGHYAPEFRPRRLWDTLRSVDNRQAPAKQEPSLVQVPQTSVELIPEPAKSIHKKWSRIKLWTVVSVPVVALAAGAFFWQWNRPDVIDEFWAPVVKSHSTVTFCLPNGAGRNPGMASLISATNAANDTISSGLSTRPATFLDHETIGENVVFSDVLAAVRISNLMAVRHRESRFRLNDSTTLDDLRQGPTVLIGGMDNQWTLRAIAPLRFHFAGDDSQETFWIVDNKNPQNKDWILALKTHYPNVTRDYAIIARLHDQTTGKPEVIVAGIGMSGTAAAGEFLVDPDQLSQLRQKLGHDFLDHDFEAVLSTDVVNGIAGSPKILTVATW